MATESSSVIIFIQKLGNLVLQVACGFVLVVGMGGLGNTTLGKKVCSQRYVKQHYLGGTESEGFQSGLPLLLSLSLSKNGENELGKRFPFFWEGNKCLIVLDDVWKFEVRGVLSSYFAESNKSRVLITTRNHLDGTESWELFLKNVKACLSQLW